MTDLPSFMLPGKPGQVQLLPAQLFIFVFGLMPWQLAGWFFALLVVEHVAQEVNRLLVAMQHQLLASLVLFLRMGLWIWAVLPLIWINPEYRQINTVFVAWLVGASLAIAAGICRGLAGGAAVATLSDRLALVAQRPHRGFVVSDRNYEFSRPADVRRIHR